jgi:hypothetical protein
MILMAGCTRAAVPPNFETNPEATAVQATATAAATRQFNDPDPEDLAVVWVAEDESLPLRASASIAAESVTELAYDQAFLQPTGLTTSLGSSTWQEVFTRSGEMGWVPSWNLTEQVEPELFCQDAAVNQLLANFRRSLEDQDDSLLQSLLSPKRGLIIRHDLSNPEVILPQNRMNGLFSDRRIYQWGTRFASQTLIQGSFREVVLPSLLEVLLSDPQLACNEIEVGPNSPDANWPGDYQNLNYISLYRPAGEGGNSFDWRTWVVVVEYVEAQPYIALLVQIRPQV